MLLDAGADVQIKIPISGYHDDEEEVEINASRTLKDIYDNADGTSKEECREIVKLLKAQDDE